MVKITASEIALFLKKNLIGDNIEIYSADSLKSVKNGSIIFLNRFGKNILDTLPCDKDYLIIAVQEYKGTLKSSHILSDNPRLDFAKVIKRYFIENKKPHISENAFISKSANIGENCIIETDVYVGHNVTIGNNCILDNSCIIHDNTYIGDNVHVKAKSIIGEQGFGFEKENEVPFRIPHIGNVVIKDNVEIGCLNTINRGTLNSTIISENVKTSDNVHIAHNVFIGKNTMIAANVSVNGSVNVGESIWIGPNSSIKNGIKINNKAIIGIGSVVIKDVLEDQVVGGNPAKEISKKN